MGPVRSSNLQKLADKLISSGLEEVLEFKCDFQTHSTTDNKLGSFEDGFTIAKSAKGGQVFFVSSPNHSTNYFFFGTNKTEVHIRNHILIYCENEGLTEKMGFTNPLGFQEWIFSWWY